MSTRLLNCFVILAISVSPVAMAQIPCLTGFVSDGSGAPVFDADLDFDNAVTGQRITTPNDNTDESGFYRVCVLSGRYHVSYAPPPGTHLLGHQIFNLNLTQSQILNVTLNPGYVIRGVVRDSLGQPLAGIDFDVDSLGAGRVFTPNDNSDSAGAYWLVTPPGHFRLRLSPPPGSRFREIEIDSIFVSRDTLIDFIMSTGHIVSGAVRDAGGAGLDSILIDVRDIATGAKVFVPNNETDSLGNYHIVLPTGTFTLRYVPPYGSRLVGIQIDSMIVSGDLVINQVLYEGTRVDVSVRDSSGAPVVLADLDFSLESSGQRVFIPYDETDSLGHTMLAVAPDMYTIRVDPPPGSILDRLTLRNVAIRIDTAMVLVLPEVDRVALRGRLLDRRGAGVEGVTLILKSSISGPEIPLHGNISDSLGYYDFDIPIGTFALFFVPERGSHYLGMYREEVTFYQDTTWNDVVFDDGAVVSARVMDDDGRPLTGVDFDFIAESTGQEIYAPHDATDSSGTADITVPPGAYRIEIAAPPNSSFSSTDLARVVIDGDTSLTIFLVRAGEPPPKTFKLKQNYPNPFNQTTLIAFTFRSGGEVSIIIYNTLGQRIQVISAGYREAGYHEIGWDGRDDKGKPVASGVYFYKLITPFGDQTRQMLLIR